MESGGEGVGGVGEFVVWGGEYITISKVWAGGRMFEDVVCTGRKCWQCVIMEVIA